MAMKARYTVIDGEIITEKRSGVRSLYVPDSLGSTRGLINNAQTQTDAFAYWPYGEQQSRTGMTSTPFQFVGSLGYYNDSPSKTYVRARFLDTARGRWVTQDPLGFAGGDLCLYRYVANQPITLADASGQDMGCQQRTKQYCDSAKRTGSRFENCACRISRIICNLITSPDPVTTDKMRICMNCLNSCMFDHWKNRDTNPWQTADYLCCYLPPDECCAAMVSAEQQGLTNCKNGRCKSVCSGRRAIMPPANLPEDRRIRLATNLCCKHHSIGGPGDPLLL